MPPPFAPSHSWVCPIWGWAHWQFTTPPGSIFESAHSDTSAWTTMLYVANSWSVPISIHVDCYVSDGTLETGVTCSGPVGARQRLQAALQPDPNAGEGRERRLQRHGRGLVPVVVQRRVTPAAMNKVVLGMPGWIQEVVVPVEPVELEPAAVEVAPVTSRSRRPRKVEAVRPRKWLISRSPRRWPGSRACAPAVTSTAKRCSRRRAQARPRDPTRHRFRRLIFSGEPGLEPRTESQ